MNKIKLKSLEEALNELDRLRNSRKKTALGQWSTAQIYSHLRYFFEGSIKGFPESRSSFIRKAVGPNLLSNIKKIGYMPSGFRNSFLHENANVQDEDTELNLLITAVREFMIYNGKLSEHPIYGKMNREDWNLIHAYHIANHLSFIDYGSKPTSSAATSAKKKTKKAVKKKTAAKKKKIPAAKKAAKKKNVKKTAGTSAAGKKKTSKKKTAAKKKKKKS